MKRKSPLSIAYVNSRSYYQHCLSSVIHAAAAAPHKTLMYSQYGSIVRSAALTQQMCEGLKSTSSIIRKVDNVHKVYFKKKINVLHSDIFKLLKLKNAEIKNNIYVRSVFDGWQLSCIKSVSTLKCRGNTELFGRGS